MNGDRDILDEDGWAAQNDVDPDDVVLFYPDGKIWVVIGGIEHPYTADDLD